MLTMEPEQDQAASVVAVTDITVEPRLIPPAGRGALMGLRSRTRFTKSKRQPTIRPFVVPPSLFRERKLEGGSPDLKFREVSKLSPFGCGTHRL